MDGIATVRKSTPWKNRTQKRGVRYCYLATPKIAFEKPKKMIGSNTIDCIKSGMLYGNAGAIDGLIDRFNEELGEKCTVIATGGLAKLYKGK